MKRAAIVFFTAVALTACTRDDLAAPRPHVSAPNYDDISTLAQEVRTLATDTGPKLVAAIELVSPGNKDRPAERRAFAIKCASHLAQGDQRRPPRHRYR